MKIEQRIEQAKERWKRLQEGRTPLIFVGTATCGLAAGAGELFEVIHGELERLEVKAEVIPVGCIGMCFAEPLVDIKVPGQPRICYSEVTPEKIKKILKSHLKDSKPLARYAMGVHGEAPFDGIPRLFDLPVLKPQVRIALRNCGIINPADLDQYLARDGYRGFLRALSMEPEEVIEEVVRSGLRGRGGAGFPTGQKWKFCRGSPGEDKYIICNADEGDPGAFMDRSVLEGDPHAVLEGMCIAAYAIGANHGYVYIRAEYPLAISRLRIALAQMEECGLLGDNILDSGLSFDIQIKEGAGAFVCGEETALIASIEGGRGMPRSRPPFPAVKGLFQKPSNINNVETLANVSNILRRGADWFASFGTEKSKGTKTFALTGKINRPGLIEVPLGITLGEVVDGIGGGVPGGGRFKAAQTGGPSGGCLPVKFLDTPIDYESLLQAGSIMGSGGLVVTDETTCMVDLARYFLTFTQSESCGKCSPCRLGTREMLNILERICTGGGQPDDIELLETLGHTIKSAALCGLGQTAPNPVLTTIKYFCEEYREHIHKKYCRAAVCKGLVDAPCHHTCPAGVEAHKYVRAIACGKFDEAYLVVRERMPLPSACALVCFHTCEARCRRGSLDEPIAIRALKDAAVRYGGRAEAGTGKKVKSSGRKVAVVGSGPAGLTAAYYLSKLCGHKVTVFESLPKVGGMLRVGIPRYRLPEEDLERDIDIVRKAGVVFKTRTKIKSVASLREKGFDAVFLALGAHRGFNLGVEGDSSRGVMDCVEFLRKVSLGKKVKVGERVAVVGGGNSAIDAARTSLRLGAEATILYRRSRDEMPAADEEILKALEEGVKLEVLTMPAKIQPGKKGLKVTCQRMRLGGMDSTGRRRPVPLEGSEYIREFDTVLVAVGQHPEIPEELEVEIGPRQRIGVDETTLQTSVEGVFAGGDVVTGPASVVQAIADGRRAAEAIDRYLGGSGAIEEKLAPDEDISELPPLSVGTKAWPRYKIPYRVAKTRAKTFERVELGYSREAAVKEAGRCLRCDLEE